MSKDAGIPYKTLSDLKNCKTKIENCRLDTLYKMSEYFGVSMDELYVNLKRIDFHDDFEIYKNDLCHFVKRKPGATIKQMLLDDTVSKYWEEGKYLYALYSLAMIDYISKKYNVPLYVDYDYYRKQKLKNPWFPNSINVRLYLFHEDFNLVTRDAIPEFKKYNIYEGDLDV